MKKLRVYLATFYVCAMVFGLGLAQAQTQSTADNNKPRAGRSAAGVHPDKFRADSLLATVMPASELTIRGMVETALGGRKFADGTLQPAAAGKGGPIFAVAHDGTLQGDGTSDSPLGVKLPLNLDGLLTVNGNIQAQTVSSASLVSSSLTVSDNIRAHIVSSDASFVSGLLQVGGLIRANSVNGNAIEARGGDGTIDFPNGGLGIRSIGGKSDTGEAGRGVEAEGGESVSGPGGIGVGAFGGSSHDGDGGTAVIAAGGFTFGGHGGDAVVAVGGASDIVGGAGLTAKGGNNGLNGFGGIGVSATGGNGFGAGHSGGVGLIASGGLGGNGATGGLAGQFNGDVEVTGNLSKGGGSFKIDHPLDPANKFLYHSFVESPDMKNIYDGVAQLDARGEAIVTLPDWFSALNRDFRYLLTAIGAPAPNLFIAQKVEGNRFKIAGGQPGQEVSWLVTGIRQDAFANKHRIPVEQDKADGERGFYLHPDAFGQPDDKNILLVQHPEMMPRLKEAGEAAKPKKAQ